MVKSKKDTIAEFNEQVNMSVEELEEWLQDPQSKKAGTGVGIESAAKIIEILKKNPTKDPSKYDEEDLEHMRKVVGYNKRHLAQESHLKDTKTKEELANTKSTISLKNWGHDPLKTLGGEAGSASENESKKEKSKPGKSTKTETDKPSEDKEVGSKRKHDDDEPQGKSTSEREEGADETEDDGDKGAELGGGDETQRARKKSKTTAEEPGEAT